MNGKLLGRLKCLCVLDLGEDEYEKMGKDNIPANWPDHFDNALKYLNKHILPHLKFTLNKLLLGLVINTACTPKSMASEEPKHADVIVQMAYMDQLHLDRKVTVRAPKEVIFKVGQLMQVYRNNLNFTFQLQQEFLQAQDTGRSTHRQLVQLTASEEAIKEMWGEEEKKADRVEVVLMGAEGNGANTLFKSMELVEGWEASGSPPLDSLPVE
ncbi:hypothetical protein H0H87_002952 [Tephrocybe sp. NHM501043]|nr:hypothetical protein H0H87_002952 [Tephrocybe sp. NHM501043]